jgi:hypothetical protein
VEAAAEGEASEAGGFIIGTDAAPKHLQKVNVPADFWKAYRADLEGLGRRERLLRMHSDFSVILFGAVDKETGLAPIAFEELIVPLYGGSWKDAEAGVKRLTRDGKTIRTGFQQPTEDRRGYSRSYGPPPKRRARLEAQLAEAKAGSAGDYVNALTGKATTARPKGSVYGPHGNRVKSDLIAAEVKALNRTPVAVNVRAAADVVERRRGAALSALRAAAGALPASKRAALTAALEASGGLSEAWPPVASHLHALRDTGEAVPEALREAESLFSKFKNDATALDTFRRQRAGGGAGVIQYRPAVVPSPFGRPSELGVGALSCSRPLKRAAFSGEAAALNVDLASAHDRWLPAMMRAAGTGGGFDPSWMEWYLELDEPKRRAADEIGITARIWKRVQKAIYNGARLLNDSGTPYKGGSVWKYLRKDGREGTAAEKHAALCDFLRHGGGAPFAEEIQRFADWLVDVWASTDGAAYAGRGGLYAENDAGARLKVSGDGAPERSELRRKLTAFRLQGKEQRLILTFSQALRKAGFPVLSNQADGLVIEAEPEDWPAVQRVFSGAAEALEETEAQLERKPLCKSDEWEGFWGA